jgi:hypothetical protein
MPGIKTTRANAILDSELGGTLYLALYTVAPSAAAGGTEVSGGSYAREIITMGAAASGVKSSTGPVTFTAATAGWGTVVAWAICDASSGGNQKAFKSITGIVVNNLDQVTVPSGNVSVSLG